MLLLPNIYTQASAWCSRTQNSSDWALFFQSFPIKNLRLRFLQKWIKMLSSVVIVPLPWCLMWSAPCYLICCSLLVSSTRSLTNKAFLPTELLLNVYFLQKPLLHTKINRIWAVSKIFTSSCWVATQMKSNWSISTVSKWFLCTVFMPYYLWLDNCMNYS